MGNDIEAVRSRISEDNGSLKAPTAVGRQELADIVPPHDSYEGKHRFDPTASWTIEEERRVVWKTDLKLLPWLCLMMFGLQARTDLAYFCVNVLTICSLIAVIFPTHSRTTSLMTSTLRPTTTTTELLSSLSVSSQLSFPSSSSPSALVSNGFFRP